MDRQGWGPFFAAWLCLPPLNAAADELKQQAWTVPAFEAVVVRIPAEVYIIMGKKESVVVEAEARVLDKLSISVRGYTLYLDAADSFRTDKPIRVTVTAAALRRLAVDSSGKVQVGEFRSDDFLVELSGSGDVSIASLSTDALSVRVQGSGNITIDRGSVRTQVVTIVGSGYYAADHLQSVQAKVQINGSGTATLSVDDILTGEVNGSGAIAYYGNPRVHQSIEGSGEIRQLSAR